MILFVFLFFLVIRGLINLYCAPNNVKDYVANVLYAE